MSVGSVDSGGNVDGDAGFSDPVGEDMFRGTSDDDLSPTSLSAAVDLGAFEFGATGVVRDRPADTPGGSLRLTAPYPNPATSKATITLLAGEASRTRPVVYDLPGRQVMTVFDGSVTPGSEVEKPIDVSSLPAGFYMVRLTAGSQEIETRFTL